MNKRYQSGFKSLLLLVAMSALFSGAAYAKDDSKATAAAASPVVATAAAPAEKVALLDLNSATKKELSELPKIGDARSNAIIKGRPYKGKDELVSKKILTADVYAGIKDLVIAKQTAAATAAIKK